jgi:hypothetical protein
MVIIIFKEKSGWLEDCSPLSQWNYKGRNHSFAFSDCGFFREFPLTTAGEFSTSPQVKNMKQGSCQAPGSLFAFSKVLLAVKLERAWKLGSNNTEMSWQLPIPTLYLITVTPLPQLSPFCVQLRTVGTRHTKRKSIQLLAPSCTTT